jgi:hypothetical protein
MRVKNVPPKARVIYLIAAVVPLIISDYLHCDIDKRQVKAV